MAEYIEREAIAKLFDSECRGECVVCPHDDRGDCTLMNQIPAADVQPVKHGRWLIEYEPDGKPYCFHCSVCDSDFSIIRNKIAYDYCPDCGALMGDEDDV